MAKVSSLPVVVLDYIYVFLLLVPVSILSNTIFLLFFILLRFVRFIANLSPVCKRDHSERYVIVTGCDTGFGYEIVLKLAKSGFHVFAGCFTSEGVKQFQANCKSEENGSTSVTIDTEKITSFLLDVTSDESVAQAKILVTSKLPPNKGAKSVKQSFNCLNLYSSC